MRAKTVFSKAYCFDFDECLVRTVARIKVYRNGVFVKSMDSKELNFYKSNPKEKLDFTEFEDGEMILNAKKYKMWPILQNVSNAIKEDRSTSDIYILTARHNIVKPFIYEFLKRNGIEIELEHVITIGDGIGKVDISSEKRKQLKKLASKYDVVLFYDDDPKTITIANSISGIKTKLVENKNE
jgi:hypothetical protein